jgi:hypothetical protein
VAVDAEGRYLATALPTGHYKVELTREGKAVASTEVDVIIGQGIDASFGPVQSVQVRGVKSRIDISNTNNGATFTAKELARLPIATNVAAIILLAPNTAKGDPAYNGASSFGGGGASENAYYINGFPVTNPLSQLGSSELPFGAIAQASIITGGFGAEFGRSIGGVVNITTKSGTNNWEAGVMASIQPKSLRADPVDRYYANTGHNPLTDGKLSHNRSINTEQIRQGGFYVGGPLLKDKLFGFVSVEQTTREVGSVAGEASTTLARDGWQMQRQQVPRYLAKFDWNISDNHRLELTSIGDKEKLRTETYGYDAVAGTHNDVRYSLRDNTNIAQNGDGIGTGNGSRTNALKYTGNLTDDLTLTTMFGISNAPRTNLFDGYDASVPLRSINSTPTTRVPELDALGLYQNKQPFAGLITKPGAEDEIKSFRLDLEYKLGSHTLRGGLDKNKLSSINAGFFTAGGGSWDYRKVPAGSENTPVALWGGTETVGNFGGYGPRGFYVRKREFSSVTDAISEQSAQYIEDRYQVTKNLLIVGGLRSEQFTNKNGDGEAFLNVKDQIAPRLAVSWDVNGDATLKVFGSAGRYHLQLPTQVAARAASRSLLIRQDFTYSGIDANGQPTGLNPILPAFSLNNEYNQRKDPREVASGNLKPNFQDEVTLGFEKSLNASLNFGVKGTYRTLGTTIDDSCDFRPMFAYAAKHHINTDNYVPPCFIFNPGEPTTIYADFAGDGKGMMLHFTAAEMNNDAGLAYPKAERTYAALDVFAEHPLRNGWYGKMNYTWSRSKGNTEGQTRSDTGQADISISASWDNPELMVGANGLLPNDREHVLKAYGFYELTPEWTFGANALLSSGRPRVCLGNNDSVPDAYNYASEYFMCDGVAKPRGTLGRYEVEKRLDLNLVYKPAFAKGLLLKMDVFNLFDSQTVLVRNSTYNEGGGVSGTYDRPSAFAAPRAVKLSAEYHYKF